MAYLHIKNEKERDKMRAAGKLAAQTLEHIESLMVPGTRTQAIDDAVRTLAEEAGAECATLNYGNPPFPANCCISVNDVACHGIPGNYKLQDGDIVNVDVTPKLDGWHGDTSKMFLIGDVSDEDRELCEVAHGALWAGINAVEIGRDVQCIGDAIELFMLDNRFSIAKEFCGHGTGLIFHEPPQILHYSQGARSYTIEPGMTFTIEPIINAGHMLTRLDIDDRWTVRTWDRSKSAQWEHTILVTEDAVEILTLREEEK